MGRMTFALAGLVVLFASSATAAIATAQPAARPAADYPDGAYAFAIGDHAAARDLFGTECQAGTIKSCLRAADDWRVGRGGPQDYDRAIEYADIACRAGEPDGCTVAATIHFHGRETGEPNYQAARDFYARACEMDDPRGCAGLGNMQFIGLGGLRDRREGASNLRQACRQDFEYACEQLRDYGQNR